MNSKKIFVLYFFADIFFKTAFCFTAKTYSELQSMHVATNEQKDSLFISIQFDTPPLLSPAYVISNPPSIILELPNTRIKKPFSGPGAFPLFMGVKFMEEELSPKEWLSRVQIFLSRKTGFHYIERGNALVLGLKLSQDERKRLTDQAQS
ncbi:MAG: hypothetical protein HQK83_09625, partial [Fibrobacteria bacterium]|nr:hypothetical protein [Fibrobacteria bacterium]